MSLNSIPFQGLFVCILKNGRWVRDRNRKRKGVKPFRSRFPVVYHGRTSHASPSRCVYLSCCRGATPWCSPKSWISVRICMLLVLKRKLISILNYRSNMSPFLWEIHLHGLGWAAYDFAVYQDTTHLFTSAPWKHQGGEVGTRRWELRSHFLWQSWGFGTVIDLEDRW